MSSRVHIVTLSGEEIGVFDVSLTDKVVTLKEKLNLDRTLRVSFIFNDSVIADDLYILTLSELNMSGGELTVTAHLQEAPCQQLVLPWNVKDTKEESNEVTLSCSIDTSDADPLGLARVTSHTLKLKDDHTYYYNMSYSEEDRYDHEKIQKSSFANGTWRLFQEGPSLRLQGNMKEKSTYMEAPWSRERPADEIHHREGPETLHDVEIVLEKAFFSASAPLSLEECKEAAAAQARGLEEKKRKAQEEKEKKEAAERKRKEEEAVWRAQMEEMRKKAEEDRRKKAEAQIEEMRRRVSSDKLEYPPEWQARVTNLQQRFPQCSLALVVEALHATGGHAGQAASLLQKNGAQAPSNSAQAPSNSTKAEKLKAAFQLWDVDGNGYIDFSEFRTLVKRMGMTEKEASMLFEHADVNKNNCLEYAEFVDWLNTSAPMAKERSQKNSEQKTEPESVPKEVPAIQEVDVTVPDGLGPGMTSAAPKLPKAPTTPPNVSGYRPRNNARHLVPIDANQMRWPAAQHHSA